MLDATTTTEAGLIWYALTVTPRREFEAADRLTRCKVGEVYVPMRKVYRRANRYVKAKRLRNFAILPGYVFIGADAGPVDWYRALSTRWVRGVVGVDGQPLEVPLTERAGDRSGIGQLKEREQRGEFTAWGPERHMRSNREFKVGDTVEVITGPLAAGSHPYVKVLTITDEEAEVLATFLGGERVVRLRLETLEAA